MNTRCPNYCSLNCTNGQCPNAQYEAADDRWGYGIADDMGLEKISCKKCGYNTGTCDSCLWEGSKECPKLLKL